MLHFHYVTWPDFGVPTSPKAFIDFLACVRQHRVLQCKDTVEYSLKNQAKDDDDYYASVIDVGMGRVGVGLLWGGFVGVGYGVILGGVMAGLWGV